MTKRTALALLLALATPVAAQNLDGVYQWADDDPGTGCDANVYNETRIVIEGNKITFIESQCKLSNPVPIRDMPEGTLYDAVCAGEGDNWTERMLVYRMYNGVALLSRGAVRPYTRCE